MSGRRVAEVALGVVLGGVALVVILAALASYEARRSADTAANTPGKVLVYASTADTCWHADELGGGADDYDRCGQVTFPAPTGAGATVVVKRSSGPGRIAVTMCVGGHRVAGATIEIGSSLVATVSRLPDDQETTVLDRCPFS